MENLTTIIGALGGASAIGTAFWYALNLRSKRKIEAAKANQATNEVNRDNANWMSDKVQEFDDKIQELREEQSKLFRVVAYLAHAVQEEELFHCGKVGCEVRDPQIGSYKRKHPQWLMDILKKQTGVEP